MKVWLIYNVVLISTVWHTQLHIHTHTHTHILFRILFHYGLSQDTEHSSLCYLIGPCCLSIAYIIVGIY